MTTIRRKVLGDAYVALLEALPKLTVYRGEIDGDLPLLTTPGGPDPSGRVAPYVVIYDGVGTPGLEPDLADMGVDLRWSVHLIVGAGWPQDCSQAVDRIHEASYRWAPSIPGLAFGRMKPPPGYDPGPLRRNDQVSPPRFWTPMQYRLDVTT